MKINKLDLLSKGWTVSEIEHASKVIEAAENKKHIGIKFLDKSIYWAMLFLLIVGNVICSVFIIPFIFAIANFFAIIIVAVIGFIFGSIFSILIGDIRKTEHASSGRLLFTMVLSGIFNVGLIINFAQNFSKGSNLELSHNVYYVGIVYFIAFLLPYAVYLVMQNREN